MVQNLERVLQRGERIELLVEKTEELQTNAATFRKTSTALKRHFWWRNMKLWIAAGVLLIVRAGDDLKLRDPQVGPFSASFFESLCLTPSFFFYSTFTDIDMVNFVPHLRFQLQKVQQKEVALRGTLNAHVPLFCLPSVILIYAL